ncbi:MAG: DUF4981 domain-containing protein [Clostridia bacterium]|nr:DUF4981 domain-containing protein [Clostridia bacterium]
MSIIKQYHKDLKSLHVNCEKPRAYYIPYPDLQSALENNRYASGFYIDLNGEWSFNYYSSFEDLGEGFLKSDFNGKISVPGCWQMFLNRGYDVPLYSNLKYPFPLDPPFVPADNSTGHYSRCFDLSKSDDKQYYINFEGVSSCFYLYINDTFAGYSQVSHCTSEFDITGLLHNGSNRVDVIVVKWCDGSYLEDQDMFRLSGIFRDVYILERDCNSLRDITVKAEISDDLGSCRLYSDAEGNNKYYLFNNNNELIAESESPEFLINEVRLWNAEDPYLYKLVVKSVNEFIPFYIAIRKVEIKSNILYFNGKAIKIYGINRHESDPVTGYYVPLEKTAEDLRILKRANINAVRTSHYPDSPLFYELCEKAGIMVIDEADIETHGMGFEYKDTWDWFRWSALSDSEDFRESYVDRAARLYERDKNFGCVIMWSLGNESGVGSNHREMRKYIKSRDADAIVHYENSHLEFKAVKPGENITDISDVESRMYASLPYTESYALDDKSEKPFFFCEYACSMTTGDIHAHADLFRKYPQICGGCFWEMTDHAVKTGEGKFRYGGDFGDYPNDNICCLDGIVFPDRRLKPGYYDLKKAYEPFECKLDKDRLTVFNRNYFTSLSGFYLYIYLESNGEKIAETIIDNLDIAPQTSETYTLDSALIGVEAPNLFLTVSLRLKSDTTYAGKDFEAGFNQFELSSEYVPDDNSRGIPGYTEDSRYVIIKTDSCEYVFDKPFGKITACKSGGKELDGFLLDINIEKASGNNEKDRFKDRQSASTDFASLYVKKTEVEEKNGYLQITCESAVGGASVVPVLNGTLIYRFCSDGRFDIISDFEMNKKLEEMDIRLGRFGFMMNLPSGFRKMVYFGKGPVESYADRHRSQKYGRYTADISDNFVHYINPMENGAHFGTRYAFILDKDNLGFKFTPLNTPDFIFNASAYTPVVLENTAHDDELVSDGLTHVFIDYKQDIRGGRDYFEDIEPERRFDFGNINFGFSVTPFCADKQRKDE